jgi:hypothetical protein
MYESLPVKPSCYCYEILIRCPLKINFATSGIVTTVLNLLTSYLTPDPQLRRILLASGLIGLTLAPYTWTFLGPINKELLAADERNGLEGKDMESAEAKRCMQLINSWGFRHHIREGVFGTVWMLIVWAVMSARLL